MKYIITQKIWSNSPKDKKSIFTNNILIYFYIHKITESKVSYNNFFSSINSFELR